MTTKIEKKAVERTMEDLFCNGNLLIRIIAAGKVQELIKLGLNVLDEVIL